MISNKYGFYYNKEIYTLIFIFIVSFLIRIPTLVIYGDNSLDYEWKILVENLIEYKKLGWKNCEFAYFQTKVCLPNNFLLPNLWMPPLYIYYLYFFTFFQLSEQSYIILILLTQIIFSSLSVIFFYKINKFFFSSKLSLFSSMLFSFFPLYLYGSSQISSITLQVFLLILFFYYFFKLVEKRNFLSVFLFSFSGGLLILLRGEFYAILILTIFYLFYLKINIKKILLIILISTITVSPYLIRNMLVFEKFTMMKSFGYNIWKGNHPYAMNNSLIVGAEIVEEDFRVILDNVPRDKFLRFNFDKIFFKKAIENIKEEPKKHFIFFLKKSASYILIDFNSKDPNYYNPLHYIPVLIIGVLSLIGMILSNKKSHNLNYLILVFFAYTFIFSTVSILPRYKLIILPIQIIFTNVLIRKFIHRYE